MAMGRWVTGGHEGTTQAADRVSWILGGAQQAEDLRDTAYTAATARSA
jgi:hypothetical protein